MLNAALSTVEQWDALHQRARHRLEYPSEHVVRFLAGVEWPPEETRAHKALDIGCGSGRHSRLLTDFGYVVDACDASPAAVATTRRLGVAKAVKCAPMTDLPYPDGVFDVALAYGVFYYGTHGDVDSAVAELFRVLRPGGQAFVCMRAADDWRNFMTDPYGVFHSEGEPEDGMALTFMSMVAIPLAFRAFSSIAFERAETTTHFTTRVNADWLITVTK